MAVPCSGYGVQGVSSLATQVLARSNHRFSLNLSTILLRKSQMTNGRSGAQNLITDFHHHLFLLQEGRT